MQNIKMLKTAIIIQKHLEVYRNIKEIKQLLQ